MRFAVAILLAVSIFCFALGVTLPLIEVKRLLLFADRPSLLEIVAGLWNGGDSLLAAAIFLFSVAFPAIKLVTLQYFYIAQPDAQSRLPALFAAMSKWSMLDVLLVALVIFAAKTSGIATALTLPGLWFFTISVVLTAIASALIGMKTPSGSPR